VDASELSPGYYYLGFFNMDYYEHSPCEYELTVTMNSKPPNPFKPMMSIWMGVCFSVVLCVVLSFFKRMVFRNIQNQLRATGELVRRHVFVPPVSAHPSSPSARVASPAAESPIQRRSRLRSAQRVERALTRPAPELLRRRFIVP
jgi:hypothetical protein